MSKYKIIDSEGIILNDGIEVTSTGKVLMGSLTNTPAAGLVLQATNASGNLDWINPNTLITAGNGGIYTGSGSLSAGITTLTMATNDLNFASTADASLLKIDGGTSTIAIGSAVSSTQKLIVGTTGVTQDRAIYAANFTKTGGGPAYGVYAQVQTDQAANNIAVLGTAAQGTVENIGVRGQATSTGTANYGIQGITTTSNTATNYAGYFSGTNGGAGAAYGIVVNAGNSGFGTLAPVEMITLDGNILYESGTNRFIKMEFATSGNGNNLNVEAGGSSAGFILGGDLNLVSGTATNNSTAGNINLQTGSGNGSSYGFTYVPDGNIYLHTGIGPGDLVINQAGADYNVRIEGDTDPNLFVTDAGLDMIGIGIAAPTAKLHIQSDGSGTGNALLLENSSLVDLIQVTDNGNIGIGIVPNVNGSPTSGQHPSERMSFKEGEMIQFNSPSGGAGVPGGIKIVENNASFSNYGLKITYDTYNSAGKSNFVTQSANVVDGGLAVFRGTGRVSVFTTTTAHSPTEVFDVNGNARFRVISAGASAGALHYTSNGTLTTNTSDITMKENIVPLTSSLDKILQLQGVSFDWIDGGEHSIGLIAQEVEKVVPELAFTNLNSDKMGVHYDKTVALLIEAIKEQQEQIEDLKKEVNILKG